MQRAEAERSESHALKALAKSVLQCERRVAAGGATREQERDGFVAQPPGGILDDGQRRRVEPLDIVDRDEERLAAPEQPEHGEECRRDPARVWRRAARVA